MGSKDYFDQIAQQWDVMRQEFFSDNVRTKAVQVAMVQRGLIAADVGAGTGFLTEELLQRGLRVIAIDESQAMLDAMKRKFHDSAVEYRIGESAALPLNDGSVNYAFANMYLHHVESPPDAIKEMTRIVKPGGRLVITDLDEHGFEFLRSVQHDRWLGFKREDIRRWFEEAGLEDVVIDCVGEDCCTQSSTGHGTAQVSIFVAAGRRPVNRV